MNSVHDIDESQPAVLLVDDEPDMVRGLARLLRLDGFRVESAGSIAEMLDGSNWSDYIAILVDRKLPDGFAEDVLPQLRSSPPMPSLSSLRDTATCKARSPRFARERKTT
jgi:DNA-binding response OmpR family regulator